MVDTETSDALPQESEVPRRAKQTKSEPAKSNPLINSGNKSATSNRATMSRRRLWGMLVGLGLVMATGGFFLYPVLAPALGLQAPLSASNATAEEMMSGRVALTEPELIDQVTKHNLVAYWIGPRVGYKYTLSVTTDGQVYVRYLPNGEGVDKPDSDFIVIGTYPQKDAFDITAAAGSQENAVTFVNGDGAQVFYNKILMSNVYLAYPDEDYEIEVYSPVSGDSVLYATTPGQVNLIR